MTRYTWVATAAVAASLSASVVASDFESMADGVNGWTVSEPLFTVGETINGYTPPGILDGLGAFRKDNRTVRVLSNHELLHFRGNEYQVSDGQGGSFGLTGARVSYFDIDVQSRQVVDAGLAYDTIYDPNGNIATDAGVFTGLNGYSRFCSSQLVEANTFASRFSKFFYGKYNYRGRARGLEDTIYFTGEEDGGFFNPIGGYAWALDVEKNEMWAVPAFGRGAWENVTAVDTGSRSTVAFILADDTSPFDFNEDGQPEASPLYLYIGYKNRRGDFLERNGLRNGKLFVFVANDGTTLPSEFNTAGTLEGRWIEVDNRQRPELAQPDRNAEGFDRLGYDAFGFPTQGNLFLQAQQLGAFGFSRPEDIAFNPRRTNQVVVASTGVDTYDIDPETGNGADTFGTLYTVTTNFRSLSAKLRILYDGDADPGRTLRSPDNVDWADNGRILVQEDEAEEDTASGDEVLFGEGAANVNEAGIVLVDPYSGATLRVANINRDVVLDASIADPTAAVDMDAGFAGEWESSGILDVSSLFGERRGTFFIFDVQAHGIEDQEEVNPSSRINDGDLVEGGQLLFLEAP